MMRFEGKCCRKCAIFRDSTATMQKRLARHDRSRISIARVHFLRWYRRGEYWRIEQRHICQSSFVFGSAMSGHSPFLPWRSSATLAGESTARRLAIIVIGILGCGAMTDFAATLENNRAKVVQWVSA